MLHICEQRLDHASHCPYEELVQEILYPIVEHALVHFPCYGQVDRVAKYCGCYFE